MALDIFDSSELTALAKLDVESSRLDLALEKLKAADQREDRAPELDTLLARIYAQLRLFGKAVGHFERYLQVHPEAVLERFQLGMVHFDNGDFLVAIGLWDGILSQHSTHPPALYYRARARLNIQQEEEARRDLEVLVKSAPVDNLYFGRAKELLDAIDARNRGQKEGAASDKAVNQIDNVYKADF